jgi:hypothetical protein
VTKKSAVIPWSRSDGTSSIAGRADGPTREDKVQSLRTSSSDGALPAVTVSIG